MSREPAQHPQTEPDAALPGDEIVLSLGGPSGNGANAARAEDGRVVFVSGGLAGERVRARITQAKPGARFMQAQAVEILEPSPHRRPHPWREADTITGWLGAADLGHAAPPQQRAIKARTANDQLERLGGLSRAERPELFPDAARSVDPVSAQNAGRLGAMTRVAFAVSEGGRLGMHPKGQRKPLPVSGMPLASAALDAPELFALDFSGLERVELAQGSEGVLVLLIPEAAHRPVRGGRGRGRQRSAPRTAAGETKPAPFSSASQAAALAEQICRAFASHAPAQGLPVSVALFWPKSGRLEPVIGPSSLTQRVSLASGGKAFDLEYRVTGDGFWQVHEGAPAALAQAVLDLADPQPGERIADLYGGAGLFAAALAAAEPEAVVETIEAYPVTSADAVVNLEKNVPTQVAAGRATALCSRVEEALGGKRFDTVVADPSRQGLGGEAVELLHATGAQKLVYISCDSGSFARDIKALRAIGWEMVSRELFDIYPNTHHVETAALLKRA